MMHAGCVFCGRRPVAWHHPTGRTAPNGPYLDPDLTVPLCLRHHNREHELLRRAGWAFPPEGAEPAWWRLGRVFDLACRAADAGRLAVFVSDLREVT